MTLTPEGSLAALVRRVLAANDLTQAELARRMGVAESSLSTLINRPKKQLPVETITKLATALDVHVSEVVAAYLIDAGVPAEQFKLDGPETAIVVGAMQRMDVRGKRQLARLARDFLDDEK